MSWRFLFSPGTANRNRTAAGFPGRTPGRRRFGFGLAATMAALVLLSIPAVSATYQVGPGRPYATLQQVAGLLNPGDVVEVDGAATYPGDIVFSRAGSAAQPITIRGVRVNGLRPVLSGGTNTVAFTTEWPYSGPGADHYILEGFEVTGGSFRGIYHQANDLTIRDCVVHDCPAHGILGADQGSGSCTLEYSEVYRCGSGDTRHQIYMATDEVHYPGSVFRMQFCYIHEGLGGNNVKSRAERNEIYYNWIEGAYYHELELIGPDEGDGGNPALKREDSDVVGNVLWKKTKPAGDSDYFAVTRIGGDGTGETFGRYRFVNNTILAGARPVFRIFDGIESLEAHNNVLLRIDGAGVQVTRTAEANWASGSETISGAGNWIETGSTNVPAAWTGTLTGADPGFADLGGGDVRPAAGSPLIDAGTESPAGPPGYPFPNPLFPPGFHPPDGVLLSPGAAEARPEDEHLDIGAYEWSPGTINGDAATDLLDLVVLQATLAGVLPAGTPPCVCPLCADFDQDGQLTSADAVLLADWLAGN
jgi:hypothetical protein